MPLTQDQTAALLTEARKNRDKAEDDVRLNNQDAAEDLRFVAGEQWNESDLNDRATDGRPALTINRMPQFIRQVTGDIRLNRPSIKVRPVDSGADVDIAKIYTGLIRNIEYQSKALKAYVTSAESAARCGIGHFRIVTEFSNDSSFEQDIRIRSVKNPFAVYWDPAAERDDKTDANWCFILSEIDHDTFTEQWPEAVTTGFTVEQADYDTTLWRTRHTITVAEYWRKEATSRTLGQLITGEVIDMTDLPTGTTVVTTPDGPIEITRTRTVDSHRIMQYLITDQDVLEGPFEWVGRDFPIIPVLGEEIHLRDRVVRHGMIRFAKDSQRQYNYWQTNATETMALAPKSPYLVTQEQVEGYENEWQQANRKNFSYLRYKHDPNAPGPPTRNPPPDFPVAASNMMQISAQDMHATTGIYPSSLGGPGNETSGRAISLRQTEGDVGTFVYIDNLSSAIEQAGRVLVDIIPKIYDTERVVRILGEDDSEDIVTINQITDAVDENGDPILLNDITVGRYDVVVTTGPSFSTKRMEAAQSMQEIIRAYPPIMQIAGDLLFKAMDVPGAELIAERLAASMGPATPDPKDEADTMKSIADARKKQAEAEGQQIENISNQIQLAVQSGILQQVLTPLIQEQLQIALSSPQQPFTPRAV